MSAIRFQQGDVIFKPVRSFPENLEIQKAEENNVIQSGESTNHFHRLLQGQGKIMFRREDLDQHGNGFKYLDLLTPGVVTHEEHKPVALPPGKYEVHIVREYDHFSGLIRQVRD